MEDEYFYGTEKEIVSSMTEWLVENIEAVAPEEEKKKKWKTQPCSWVSTYTGQAEDKQLDSMLVPSVASLNSCKDTGHEDHSF